MKALARLAAVALAAFAFSGCFESDQQITLNPDGSGKLVWVISMKDDENAKVDEGQFGEMEKSFDGIVAWVEPKVVKENGKITITIIAYFDDINAVKIYKSEKPGPDGQREIMEAFEYKKGDATSTLVMKGSATKDMAGKAGEKQEEPTTEEGKKFAEEMKKMMRDAMKGFRWAVSVKAPGTVTEVTGFPKKEGRVASLEISEQLMLDGMDEKPEAKKELEAMTGDMKLTWGKSEVSQSDLDAFQKELAAAKAAYEKKKAAEQK